MTIRNEESDLEIIHQTIRKRFFVAFETLNHSYRRRSYKCGSREQTISAYGPARRSCGLWVTVTNPPGCGQPETETQYTKQLSVWLNYHLLQARAVRKLQHVLDP